MRRGREAAGTRVPAGTLAAALLESARLADAAGAPEGRREARIGSLRVAVACDVPALPDDPADAVLVLPDPGRRRRRWRRDPPAGHEFRLALSRAGDGTLRVEELAVVAVPAPPPRGVAALLGGASALLGRFWQWLASMVRRDPGGPPAGKPGRG
ncbi:MAG TPA: hypothetical protein VEB20_13350 [Azospirillaceae bacterium]|nr:hypothetical protein [Azospirillaceae bacterium]